MAAENDGRTIVFIDDSGLSQRPHRCRTWAPRGQTPVLQYRFNWKTLVTTAIVDSWWNFYFHLYPGTIRMVWDFVRQQRGRLWLEFMPAYAPELNPVEYLSAHWKHHELPNFLPRS